LLLEELATANTAVHEQHATQIIYTDHLQEIIRKVEESNRIPIIVYDTEWNDEQVKSISNEIRPNIQNAHHQYPSNTKYEHAKINSPEAILSRELYQHIENNNQEQIETISFQRDDPYELISVDNNQNESYEDSFQNQPSRDNQELLCRPIDNHLQMNDEHTSSLSDDSLLIRHQQQSNINFHETTPLENPLRSTAFLTLNYPQHDQELTPPWQRVFDQQFSNQHHHEQENLQFQTEQISPRYLPSISSPVHEQSLRESDNYANEFQQVASVHEHADVQNSNRIDLVPSTQINQSRPIYSVGQQQIPSNDEHDYSTISSIHSDRIDTTNANSPLIDTIHVESPPTIVDIEVRVRPTYSETSSLIDMESCLNRLEDSFEPEQHLPLVDQISLSYTTSIRSTHDRTQRAIERYEQEHPYFSRALPREWLTSTILPHDEQLVEQWTVEKNLETIQQQVELRTNTECVGVVVVTAIANDACSIGERFEDEESNSINTKTTNSEQQIDHIASAIIASHCSPTSDYETDSLDKDNDTTSTTTSIDGGPIVTATPLKNALPSDAIPVDDLLEKFANEQKTKNDTTKDFLFTMGFGQEEIKHKQDTHLAKENELEHDDNISPFNFDEYQRELLDIFFEPPHFHLPLINEISIYQMSFHNEYQVFSSSNLPLPIMHNDDNISSNECKTIEQEIFSIAQINNQSDHEEDLESISYKYEQPSYIEHYHIQSLYPFPETLFVHIDEPPIIIECEDDQSISSILPDVIPSTTIQNEVKYANGAKKKGRLYACISIRIDQIKLFVVNQCRIIQSIILRNFEPLTCFCTLMLLVFVLN